MSGLHLGLRMMENRSSGLRPGDGHVFALGDSRTLDNFRSGTITSEGPMTWTRQRSLGRMSFAKVDNLGVGGATTSDILASHFPLALASSARTLILLAGTNDCRTSIATETTLANLDAMIDAWVGSSADRVVVVADEAPWASGVGGDMAQLLAVRDHVRSRQNSRAGIYLWPLWTVIAASADSEVPRGDSYRDGLHWSKAGAFRAGASLWRVLDGLLPQGNALARPGVIAGGDFIANTGGTVPEDWTIGTTAGVTTRMEADARGNWLVLDINAVSSLNLLLYPSGALPAGVTAGSSVLDAQLLYAIDPGSENLSRVTMELWKQSGGRLRTPSGDLASDGNDMGSGYELANGPLPGEGISGLLRPPPTLLPADATQLRPWALTVRGLPGLEASGTVRFAQPQLRLVP